MKVFVTTLALCVAIGSAFGQDTRPSNGDEALKNAILKKVEEKIKANHEQLLKDVRAMLDESLKATSTKPAAKQPGFIGFAGKEVADGVQILQVIKDTPAMKAGLAKGDVVLAINGKKVAKVTDIVTLLNDLGAGAQAKVQYKRGGQTSDVDVTLMARPAKADDDGDDGDDDDGNDGDDD